MNEFQKHITQDLGCILGIFEKDGIISCCLHSDHGESDALTTIGTQLLILSIKHPNFERILHAASMALKESRKDKERLVDEFDPETEIVVRRYGTENQ